MLRSIIAIFFLSTQHSYIKKNKGQIVNDIDFLAVQNGVKACIKPSLQYYCKKMLAYLLTNLKIQLDIVNEAWISVFGVISNFKVIKTYSTFKLVVDLIGFLQKTWQQLTIELPFSFMHFVIYQFFIDNTLLKSSAKYLSNIFNEICCYGKEYKAQYKKNLDFLWFCLHQIQGSRSNF